MPQFPSPAKAVTDSAALTAQLKAAPFQNANPPEFFRRRPILRRFEKSKQIRLSWTAGKPVCL